MATTALNAPHVESWYATATFWKRSSVFLSITLSAASLVLSAIASLSLEGERTLNALTVAGVVVNSVSIMLSALTSLDWKKQATHDKKFAAQLLKKYFRIFYLLLEMMLPRLAPLV